MCCIRKTAIKPKNRENRRSVKQKLEREKLKMASYWCRKGLENSLKT
jgi:hypothetical protein